jgi:Anti-sigma factor NepR
MQGKHNAAGARKTMNKDNHSPRIKTMYAQRSEKNPVVKLGPDIKAKIGMQLRLVYGEIVDQGVPERFVEIIKRLDDPNCEGR